MVNAVVMSESFLSEYVATGVLFGENNGADIETVFGFVQLMFVLLRIDCRIKQLEK